jgi:hypothetical protein
MLQSRRCGISSRDIAAVLVQALGRNCQPSITAMKNRQRQWQICRQVLLTRGGPPGGFTWCSHPLWGCWRCCWLLLHLCGWGPCRCCHCPHHALDPLILGADVLSTQHQARVLLHNGSAHTQQVQKHRQSRATALYHSSKPQWLSYG